MDGIRTAQLCVIGSMLPTATRVSFASDDKEWCIQNKKIWVLFLDYSCTSQWPWCAAYWQPWRCRGLWIFQNVTDWWNSPFHNSMVVRDSHGVKTSWKQILYWKALSICKLWCESPKYTFHICLDPPGACVIHWSVMLPPPLCLIHRGIESAMTLSLGAYIRVQIWWSWGTYCFLAYVGDGNENLLA